MIWEKKSGVPLVILFPFRVLGAAFGAVAILNAVSVVHFALVGSFPNALTFLGATGMNGVLAYGFWGTRKWVVSVVGASVALAALIGFVNFLNGVPNPWQALLNLAVTVAIFLPVFRSREELRGGYRENVAMGIFAASLLVGLLVTFFSEQIKIS